jgi:hypothetical protein
MANKFGCGPMAAFILVLLILLMVGSNEAVGYYFTHCDEHDIMDCLMGKLDDEEEPEEDSVTATGTYSYKGYDVVVAANIPLGGGNVTGTVSGTCEGKVKGTYNGQNGGVISGAMTGVCAPFFVNVPASAEYSGSVNKTGKVVPVGFTGRGAGITHHGQMTLSW